MPERFDVDAKEADQRLDKLLRQRYPDLSFGETQKLIRGGRVRVNGKRCKAADRIRTGATITLPYQGEQSVGDGHSLGGMMVFEDADLAVLNKPQGLAVQGGSSVQTHVAKMIEGTELRLVHRLDRDTSGLLVLAKGALNAKLLTRAFAAQGVEKTYLALVPEAPSDEGCLDLPLAKVLQGGEGRMEVSPHEGQAAQTDFTVMQRAEQAVLMQLAPKTGRTHQLRVHCAHVFGGIFGDSKYGNAQDRAKGLRLHAWQLQLSHPDTGAIMDFTAPLPHAYAQDLARLDLRMPETWSPA